MVRGLQAGDPQKIGPYSLLGQLGGGGMGRVYLGRSAGGLLVAVKVIRSELADDPSFRARFNHEVAAAQKVNGPYTALLIAADPDGPVPWLATAYVVGPSLAEAVTDHGPLPPDSVLALAARLAEGLGTIHAAGVVHRDLKPSNVLLAQDGPRVIDFGISRAAEASALTSTGLVVGSPGFMSPEQAEGREVGPPSDVFSLGAVLTFAATGEGPFGTGSTPALIYRIVHGQPNIGHLPIPIRSVVERCLAKEPQRRPSTATLLAELGATPLVADWLPATFVQAFARYVPPGSAPRQTSGDGSPVRVATVIAAMPGAAPTSGHDAPSTVTAAQLHRTVPGGTLPTKPGGPAGQPPPHRRSRRRWTWTTGVLIAACGTAVATLAVATFNQGNGQLGRVNQSPPPSSANPPAHPSTNVSEIATSSAPSASVTPSPTSSASLRPSPTTTPGALRIALPVTAWRPVGGASITPRSNGVFEVTYEPTYWGGVIAHAHSGCNYRFSGRGRVLTGDGYGFAVWASIDSGGTPYGQSLQYDVGAGGYKEVQLPDGSESGAVYTAVTDDNWHNITVQVLNGRYTSLVDGQVIFTGSMPVTCTSGLFIRLWNSTNAEFKNLTVTRLS